MNADIVGIALIMITVPLILVFTTAFGGDQFSCPSTWETVRPTREDDDEVFVNPYSAIGKHLGLEEGEYMDSDFVARVAVIVANNQYDEYQRAKKASINNGGVRTQ